MNDRPIPEEFDDGQVRRVLALREARELLLAAPPTSVFGTMPGRALVRRKYFVEDVIAMTEYILDRVVPEPVDAAEGPVQPRVWLDEAKTTEAGRFVEAGERIGSFGETPYRGDDRGPVFPPVRVVKVNPDGMGWIAPGEVEVDPESPAPEVVRSPAADALADDDGQFLDTALRGRVLPFMQARSEDDERTEPTPESEEGEPGEARD